MVIYQRGRNAPSISRLARQRGVGGASWRRCRSPPWITAWSFGLYLRAAGACNYYTLDRSIAPLGQQPVDPRDDHVDRDGVQSAARDDDIGVALGRLDELQVHGPHRPQILIDHRFDGSTALADIALEPADEA